MEIKFIVIDDEPPAIQVIKTYAQEFPWLKLLHTFTDAISAAEYLRHSRVDLLFLDINMPDINGLDLARGLDPHPMIIFTTAYKQYAFDGFELDAIDYLLKPIPFRRFEKAVQKAQQHCQQQLLPVETESLVVHSSYHMVKIPLHEIIYIESLEDYVRIHLAQQAPVLTLMTLKKMQEKLPASRFRRIHRSYIVAVDKVKSVGNRKVRLSSSVELPVSDSYSDFIREWKNGFCLTQG
ncbi:LytR/AlgR family response regulator transcription factor [Chitinophaga polysaccharea]|uniref:LytR/AlgR family response regulator transcription factor n=1 Tax=Chitinophaga polysaccharea TaxID=1293035 RepID=UPI00115814F1|nr:LytTR family DNA-binding domain-containing protein [Chitinophaga polysaccharea]